MGVVALAALVTLASASPKRQWEVIGPSVRKFEPITIAGGPSVTDEDLYVAAVRVMASGQSGSDLAASLGIAEKDELAKVLVSVWIPGETDDCREANTGEIRVARERRYALRVIVHEGSVTVNLDCRSTPLFECGKTGAFEQEWWLGAASEVCSEVEVEMIEGAEAVASSIVAEAKKRADHRTSTTTQPTD